MAILKRKYHGVKLYGPGEPQVSRKGIKAFLHKNGYVKYIEKLIKKLGLKDNIVWLGRLPQNELAKLYTKVNVFVMCSAIENHSNSLKEAMTVGVPSISAAVGGITSYAKDEENALLYRFEEYEVLADKISRIFDSDALSERLSTHAREKMLKLHDGKDIADKTLKIYEELIVNGKNTEQK